MMEEAYLEKKLKNLDDYSKVFEYEGINVYFLCSKDALNLLENHKDFAKNELVEPYLDAIRYFKLDPMPSYLVLAFAQAPDTSLFAVAYNDGIKIFVNKYTNILEWNWLRRTMIFHETAHIWEARNFNRKILIRKDAFQSPDNLWRAMESDLFINSNLPNQQKEYISNSMLLSCLPPNTQQRLLEESVYSLKSLFVKIKIPVIEFVRRIYTIPECHKKLYELFNKRDKNKVIDDIYKIVENKNFKEFQKLHNRKSVIELSFNCIYYPDEEIHELSVIS